MGGKKIIHIPIHTASIDYRGEDGRIPVSATFVTIPNPDSLFS
jgi:hypothetical protein